MTKLTAVLAEEMPAMGAEMVDGKWTFEGEPVELIFLIRTDSDGTRKPMGDIISVLVGRSRLHRYSSVRYLF